MPPNIGNQFPEITTKTFYSVAGGQYLATPSGGMITANSSEISVSNIDFSQAIYTHTLNAEPVVYSSQTSNSHHIGILGFTQLADCNSTSITWILDCVHATDNTFCF